MKKLIFFPLLVLLCLLSCKTNEEQEVTGLQYPETTKEDHIDVYHGVEVADPYQWLEDDLSDETAAWVSAQNEVTQSYLSNITFRDALKDRIKELLDYEKVSAPFEEGNYQYFYKNDGLQDHSVLYRTPKGESEAEPEVFLDPNNFSDDGTVGLSGVSFTEDGSMVAYMITEGGSDWRKIIVMDTEDKSIIGDTIVDAKFSRLSWKGNEGFYFSSYDNPKETSALSAKTQYHKLYYHQLNTPQSDDILVYGGDQQPNRYINGEVTEDGHYLVVEAAQNTSGAQTYVRDLRQSDGQFVQIQDDYFATLEYVDNAGEMFYFRTNIDAPNYRLVKIDIKNPAKENWVDIIPESENVLRVGSGGGKFFANYLVDAKTAIKQFDMEGKLEREVQLPGIGSAGGFGAKKEDTYLYYNFTSFTSPPTIYRYDIASGESELYRQAEVDFNPEDYETKQVFYNSKDGTRVPMFIVHKKGLELNGANPTLLYAYGGFNISLTPSFNPTRVAWLENGGVYAQPNLRGGGEYGEKWHRAGTQLNKQNVFDDFIAAGEYLIKEGYTSSDYLAISGGSNGGLLVGATMTQRPDLAKVALPAVGVMDMLKYHTFTSGAGWADDYGTAEDSPEMFEYLKGYSPYHNLKDSVPYPATLVTTADHDDRVVPAHSFKFAARLQEAHTGNNPVLIRIQTKAGHGSVSTSQIIDLTADVYAFVWENMGIEPTFAREVPN